MPPKAKKAATGKKRNKDGSESSSELSNDEEDRKVDTEQTVPKTIRQSARACMAKNFADSKRERALAARGEPKKKAVHFDYEWLRSNKAYVHPQMYRKMRPEEFTMEYYNRTGLNEVLIFDCNPEELGMKMVDEQFGVRDVERLVGGHKVITVVAVANQGSEEMSLKNFVDYYCSPDDESKKLYNVLSLEFSNSGLADLVQSPSLVRQIDWASSWPDERKTRSVLFDKNGHFTVLNNYPRVENYCLMSKTQCYTDFHVDFHGTSVWYHVKKGMKIFWIIEPTDHNLRMYEEYLKNTESSAFFGDIVEICARVEVSPGNTLIIPSGWIHAVFTPTDSLVFGGNFLHSRQAIMQLNVLQGEKRIGINKKYRYPYSEETVFFHLAKIVKAVTGRSYIRPMTKNLQMGYMEYVGRLFDEKKFNQRVPMEKDYDDDGLVWQKRWEESPEYLESRRKLARWDGLDEDEKKENEEVEKEEEEKKNGGNEEENEKKDENEGNESESMPILNKMEEAEEEKPTFGGHDDLFIDDFTFYHPISCNLDAGTGATAMHTLPLSENEPPLRVDEDVLRTEIHPLEVPELEGLVTKILKSPRVDLPWGLTRPNSLLSAVCHLLRVRRRLAEEEDPSICLRPCVLPDQEGHRRLHEEQTKASEERKRRWAVKKAKEAEGEEGEDADWTPDEPKKKRGRKSGGGQTDSGKTALPSPARVKKVKTEEEKEEQKNNWNNWNAAFTVWYQQATELRAKHNDLGKGKRDFMRKTYFTPMPMKERQHWLDEAMERIERARRDSSSTSISTSSTPIRSPLKKKSTGPHASSLCSPNGSTEADGHTSVTDQTGAAVATAAPSHSTPSTSRAEMDGSRREANSTSGHSDGIALICTQSKSEEVHSGVAIERGGERTKTVDEIIETKREKERGEGLVVGVSEEARKRQEAAASNGIYSTQSGGVILTTTPKNEIYEAMKNHLSSEGRLSNSRPPPRPSVSDDISEWIVNSLVSLNPLYPSLRDVTTSNPDETRKEEMAFKMNQLVNNVNQMYKTDFTVPEIKKHISLLKSLALQTASSKSRQTPFVESVNKVIKALNMTTPNRAAQRVNSTPLSNVISVKPVDKALLGAQPPKTMPPSCMEKKAIPSVVIGLKPPSYTVESLVNGDNKEKKEEEETENGGKNSLDNHPDFREARAEAKPPEGNREGASSLCSRERRSVFSTSIVTSPSEGMEAELILTTSNRVEKEETEEMESASTQSVKEVKKEEETDEDFTSVDERSGGRRTTKDNHWMAMKKAQDRVVVKRHSTDPADWTAFDAYLEKNYAKWCAIYQENPSNALALTIKREHWDKEWSVLWEKKAMKLRSEGIQRVYWRSETVVEQEDRVVDDRGLKVVPLGGEEKTNQGLPQDGSGESGSLVIKTEDEYLEEEERVIAKDPLDDEMIDVEGVEEDTRVAAVESETVKGEESSAVEEPPKKKAKGGRPKKEASIDKKKKPLREENENFMQSGSTPRGKGKKAKPDPNKPLIVDGVPVNPLAEPAVANAYGYDPAKDIVPLGQGQLKSAYRRSKAQLDTPLMDAKKYKLEVKHDHLLDDNDHDDTHRDDTEGLEGAVQSTTQHGGSDVTEGLNVHIGDGPVQSTLEQSSPFPQRSFSFSRRPVQSVQQTPPPLIPHAPSPLAARRISGSVTDGWAGVSGERRRSEGERRDRSTGGRSPTRKSSHFSPGESVPHTPTTPSSSSTPAFSTPSAASAAKATTRLSQAEQFAMAAPKVIDTPRLATPVGNSTSGVSDMPLVPRSSQSLSGEDPLPVEVFWSRLERITAELELANSILARASHNGN